MDDLIARLEAVTGPDRQLDEDIATAVWGAARPSGNVGGERRLVWWRNPSVGYSIAPEFTGSLDAAMMLAPEGEWNGNIMWNFGELRAGGFVELNCGPVTELGEHVACVSSYEDQEPDRHAPRPLAVAFCIAALRARAVVDRN